MKRLSILICLLVWMSAASAVTFRSDAPTRYTVKPGDTLWDLSHKFLEKPWEWRELWKDNPRVTDPNRIYPGAVLELRYAQNHPYLELASNGSYILRPEAKKEPYNPIPPIELSAIRPFINQNQIYNNNVLENAPYVVGFSDTHLSVANGDHIYVKNLRGRPNDNFAVFREDGRFFDQKQKAILGYNAKYMATAIMVRPGNPATLVITDAREEVNIGDRLMPVPAEYTNTHYYPHSPKKNVTGSIVYMANHMDQEASQQIVVIDKGRCEGIDNGSVLGIIDEGALTIDPVYHDQKIKLPNEQTGEVMVFRTFDHVSYALLMESIRPIKLGDLVQNPR